MRKIPYLLVLIILIVPFSKAFGMIDVLNVRHWTAPDHTRIVIDISDEVLYQSSQNANEIIIDLANTRFPQTIPHRYLLDGAAAKMVKLIPLSDEKLRVAISVTENVQPKIFKLGKILNKPHRIVIDVNMPSVEKKESEERKLVKIADSEKRVVVIDPGHGGEDPGAVGRRGTFEKDIVLRIAKRLKTILEQRGYKAFLTREGDYFISLKKRGQIAREYGADLFLSIHADACRSRGARGTSVYCLSMRGATTEAAKLLARNENLSDIIGGSLNGNGNGECDPITLNMIQTETINQSKEFGSALLNNLKKVNHLKYSQVQSAPFRVLKLPEITSVLVETSFISNPREELLLRNPAYQSDMAWAMASAVNSFLPLPYAADEKWEKQAANPTTHRTTVKVEEQIYKIKKGDSLEQIARQYNTTTYALMKLNNLKSKNRIYVGQKLLLPSTIPMETYIVRRGDILESIARKHNTTVEVLIEINNLKSRNKIYVGQRLKVYPSVDSGATVVTVVKHHGDEHKTDYMVKSDIEREKQKKPLAYTVKPGDNLTEIADRYDTTVAELMAINKISSKNRIVTGQRLKLDSEPVKAKEEGKEPIYYLVKQGDILEKIARKHDTTISKLMELNNIKAKNRIYVGQKLKISVPSSSAKAKKGLKEAEGKPSGAEKDIAATSSETKPLNYTVKPGDNLTEIADRYDTTVAELMAINKISSKNRIVTGQRLKLDSEPVKAKEEGKEPIYYLVKQGDILEKIARKHDTTISELMELNNIKAKNRIYVGQKLKIFTPDISVKDESLSEKQSVVLNPVADLQVEETVKSLSYTVKRGDNLEMIAFRHDTTVGDLLEINSLQSKNRIYAGQTLKLPYAIRESLDAIYIVKKGDTLEKIAKDTGTSIERLIDLNQLEQRDRICINQKLRVQ